MSLQDHFIKSILCRAVCIIIFCLTVHVQLSIAQTNIPVGTWRAHSSYNAIHSIATSDSKIFAAAKNGIVVLEKSDNSLSTYSKLNGLSGTGISYIGYNNVTGQLVVGYDDGNVDIISDNVVTNFNRLKNSTTINGSKKINHISLRQGYAYLSTDYGLVVFDLKNIEVKETWRDLGVAGTTLKIYQSSFKGDSIFLATEKGILAGSLSANLLDYTRWKRFTKNSFSNDVQFIAAAGDKLYAAIRNVGLYQYENGNWVQEGFLQNLTFTCLTGGPSSTVLITENNNVWKLNTVTNNLSQINGGPIEQPLFALEGLPEKILVGDGKNGLLSNATGNFVSYLPNGPINESCLRLKYYNNTLYCLPGGYTSSLQALKNNNGFDVFINGQWQNLVTDMRDITDADFNSPSNYFISSFGNGIEERNAEGVVKQYTENNSPLTNANLPGQAVAIAAIENSRVGLWVANYGVANSLHLLKKDNSWQTFSFPSVLQSKYPKDLLVDYNGYVWMLLDSLQGGGILVFDNVNNKLKYLADQAGSGALPSKIVHAFTTDRDGFVWLGTNSGIAYFNTTNTIFSSTPNALKPILENRYLLQGEKVTCITVDGANRKWVGTEKGVWLFNASGDQDIYNFTEENSPLLSNKIKAIEINPVTGEVFFATASGIISYRGNATQSTDVFADVKIFPNPVTPNFTGTVGISGLATDALVKITDISGKLVWQTQANGGTATWNLRDYNGRHATTGIYLVFAASNNGSASIVGKIAVVE